MRKKIPKSRNGSENDDPQYRNPRQSGNTRLVIDFAAAVGHNVTVLVWSEYENMYEINHLGGIKYNING